MYRPLLVILAVVFSLMASNTQAGAQSSKSSSPPAQTSASGYTGIGVGFQAQGRFTKKAFVPDAPPTPIVIAVAEGSPAAQAGLAVGDVVLEVNGQNGDEANSALRKPEAGVKYVVRVRRGDTEREVTVVATSAPPSAGRRAKP